MLVPLYSKTQTLGRLNSIKQVLALKARLDGIVQRVGHEGDLTAREALTRVTREHAALRECLGGVEQVDIKVVVMAETEPCRTFVCCYLYSFLHQNLKGVKSFALLSLGSETMSTSLKQVKHSKAKHKCCSGKKNVTNPLS